MNSFLIALPIGHGPKIHIPQLDTRDICNALGQQFSLPETVGQDSCVVVSAPCLWLSIRISSRLNWPRRQRPGKSYVCSSHVSRQLVRNITPYQRIRLFTDGVHPCSSYLTFAVRIRAQAERFSVRVLTLATGYACLRESGFLACVEKSKISCDTAAKDGIIESDAQRNRAELWILRNRKPALHVL